MLRSIAPGIGRARPKALGLLDYAQSWAGVYLLRRGLFLPHELGQVMDPDLAREGLRRLKPLRRLTASLVPDPGSNVARVCALESSYYMRNQLLRDTDWAGMAHSVEIRVPLVDVTLLQSLAPAIGGLLPGAGKAALAQAPTVPLPDEIMSRAKTGFGVPTEAWMDAAAGAPRLPTGSDEADERFGVPTDGRVWFSRAQTIEPAQSANGMSGVLALVTEAFGGRGGIAQYNRDFLCALAEPGGGIAAPPIIVLPRNAPHQVELPDGIEQLPPRSGRAAYSLVAVAVALTRQVDCVFCGHLYMAPLAALIARLCRARLIMQMHGIEAWPRPTRLRRAAVEAADLVLCVSRHTRAQHPQLGRPRARARRRLAEHRGRGLHPRRRRRPSRQMGACRQARASDRRAHGRAGALQGPGPRDRGATAPCRGGT